jgi:hypothetical protein
MKIAFPMAAVMLTLIASPAGAQLFDTEPPPKPKPPAAAQPAPKPPAAAQPAPKPAAQPAPKPAEQPKPPGAAAAPPAAAPKPKPVVPPAKVLARHEDWTSFVHEFGGAKTCFIAAVPKESEPKAIRRGPVYFYLTTWQKDGVRHEVSISIGYPINEQGPVKIIVGDKEFELYGRQDKAFIKNPPEERSLVEAMTGAQVMIVKGVSARGTQTTDQYSLAGLSEAVKKIEEACP